MRSLRTRAIRGGSARCRQWPLPAGARGHLYESGNSNDSQKKSKKNLLLFVLFFDYYLIHYWMMFDPLFDAFFDDENFDPLSLTHILYFT